MRLINKNSVKTFWSWWVIDNWMDAVDVAFKLATIFTFVAAANIIIVKPTLYLEASVQGVIDAEEVKNIFREKNLEVSNLIQGYLDRVNNGSSQIVLSQTSDPQLLSEQLSSNLSRSLYELGDVGRLYYLKSDIGDPITYEEGLYVQARDKALYALITIVIKNPTDRTIKNVHISFPREFKILKGSNSGFDLTPYQNVEYVLKTQEFNPFITNINIDYDAKNYNFGIVLKLGVILFIILIATIVESIAYKIKYAPADPVVKPRREIK